MTRRRVVLAVNALVVGGAERQLMHLARTLVDAGDDVSLMTIYDTEAFGDEVAELGIEVDQLRIVERARAASLVPQAIRVLRRRRPDVVVSFIYQSNVLARLAGTAARVPTIVSSIRNEHFGARGSQAGRARELMLRSTDRLATCTTTNSRLTATSLLARRVVAPKRMVVIPNGIDVAPFQRAADARDRVRADLGIGDDQFLWITAGRLVPQKDHATLLDAFADVAAAHPHHQLRIAGDGPLAPTLEADISARGLGDRVALLGLRSDVPELLAASDALVLPSAWEGLPNVVLEAMVSSRPVVATAVGGTPELVDDGVTGVLARPRDPGDLARAMRQLGAAHATVRAQMGRMASEHATATFSLSGVAEQWLELLARAQRASRTELVSPR